MCRATKIQHSIVNRVVHMLPLCSINAKVHAALVEADVSVWLGWSETKTLFKYIYHRLKVRIKYLNLKYKHDFININNVFF